MKYKGASTPRQRFIWIDDKMEELFWGTSKAEKKGSIPCSTIFHIKSGVIQFLISLPIEKKKSFIFNFGKFL